jgi:hypothetical protein
METTYRLVILGRASPVGDTASTPELARLSRITRAPGDRLGLERADWMPDASRPVRKVLVDAEERPGQWAIGGAA